MSRIYMMNKVPRSYGSAIEVTEEEENQMRALVSKFSFPKSHSLIMGKVTKTTDSEVWVDINAKSEGVLPMEEFNLRGFGEKIHVGDTVEVWLQEAWSSGVSDKQKYGNISFAKAAQMRAWRTLDASFKNRKLVDGIILSKTAGGYVISILPYGARAFLPLSQADPMISKSNDILQKYKTQVHQYLIIRMERSWNIIVSRREAIMSESNPTEEAAKSDDQADSKPKSKPTFQRRRRFDG